MCVLSLLCASLSRITNPVHSYEEAHTSCTSRPPTSSTTSATTASRVLAFKSASHLRHRLVLSLLSRRPIRIDEIRSQSSEPGLRPCEVSFLRLVEKLSQGSRLEISYTGTSLLFHPGTLAGGHVSHACDPSRSVGWYLEPLLAVAPFGKKDLALTLRGITTDQRDASVDTIRTSGLPHLAMFLETEGVELRITKRGHPPLGGGEITLTCPSVKAIKSGFDFTNVGQVLKIRGIAHSVRVSPQLSNRLVAAARSVLNRYIPDIYIYTDVYRGEDSGKSPGYALTLLASSTSHVLHSAEASSCPPPPASSSSSSSSSRAVAESWTPPTPEDLGIEAARKLLTEIRRGGCVDRGWEWLVTTMIVLGGEDVGKVKVAGPFDAFFIEHLRDLKAFFGTTFKIKPTSSSSSSRTTTRPRPMDDDDEQVGQGRDEEEAEEEDGSIEAAQRLDERLGPREEYVLSAVGIGFVNTARRAG
ncbi:hypothetical protein JCM10212_005484 [Sporobolomyces blumeae]